jgi:hypothetical protein
MRMTSKKNLLAVSLLAAVAAGVQAEGPKLSGFVDVGYNYNLNGQPTNPYRSFDDKSNTITLQNAKLGIDGKLENGVGYKIDLMYGHDAALVNATEDFSPTEGSPTGTAVDGEDVETETKKVGDLQFNLQQAYLTFACPWTGAGLTLGKFVTPFGLEVVEAKDNFNISRGLLFGYAVPFSHTGLKADKGFADGKYTATLGLVNGWDNMQDNNKGKTGIAQIGTTVLPKTSILLGGAYGAEQDTPDAGDQGTQGNGRLLVDAIVKVTPMDKLTLIGNWDIGEEKMNDPENPNTHMRTTSNYQGLGLHANYQITDMLSVAGRWETLDDDGYKTGEEQVLRSETLTVQAKKDGVIYRLEYRGDHSTATDPYQFVSDQGVTNRKSQSTVGAQVIVTF